MKLSQEEIDNLVQLKQDYSSIIYSLGDITAQIDEIESKLLALRGEQQDYLNTYKVLVERDKSLAKSLTDKYGTGKINLETGEIS